MAAVVSMTEAKVAASSAATGRLFGTNKLFNSNKRDEALRRQHHARHQQQRSMMLLDEDDITLDVRTNVAINMMGIWNSQHQGQEDDTKSNQHVRIANAKRTEANDWRRIARRGHDIEKILMSKT